MKIVMLCSLAAASSGFAAHAAAAPRSFPFIASSLVLEDSDGAGAELLAPVPGDLNGDGAPDLLAMRRGTPDVAVLASIGRELWDDPAVVFTLGDGFVFQDAIADDLNGDGIPDLVYWASRDDEVYRFGVLRGDGVGGFTPLPATDAALSGVDLPANTQFDTIALGDVTGDGVRDIVVASTSLLVLVGDGKGGFAAPEQIGFGGSTVELIDADQDGVSEIAHAESSTLVLTRRSGDSWIRETEVELYPFSQDLLSSIASSIRPDAEPGVRLYITRASPAWIESVDVTPAFAGSIGPQGSGFLYGSPSIVVADVVGGGEPDVITGSGVVYPDLRLDERLGFGETPSGGRGSVLAAVDIDLDGDTDLFAGRFNDYSLARVETASDGERSFEQLVGWGAAGFESDQPGVAVGDFDGDGRPDVFAASLNDNISAVFYQEADGTYTGALVAPTVPAARVHAADVDGDGLDDAVLPSSSGGTRVQVNFAEPGRAFAPRQGFEVFSVTRDVDTLDADNDGLTDIVAQTVDGMVVLRQTSARQFEISHTGIVPDALLGVSVADLNGDGFEDVVIGTDTGFSVFSSNGDGTFGDAIPGPPTNESTEDLELSDLDGDGDHDLVVLSTFGLNAVWIFENTGSGSFVFVRRYELPFGFSLPQWVEVADISGDGIPDVLALSQSSLIDVRHGDGLLGFERPVGVGLPGASGFGGVNQFALADMDGDGFNDVIGVGVVGIDTDGGRVSGVAVSLNRTTPRLRCPADLAEPSGVLDLSDITAFVSAFLNEEPEADLGARFGVFDLEDLVAFVETFVDGCG